MCMYKTFGFNSVNLVDGCVAVFAVVYSMCCESE